jgi:hypothetical protein
MVPYMSQSSQPSSEVATTPIVDIMNPPPNSYRGSIRDLGDDIMKSLDAELENATANEMSSDPDHTPTEAILSEIGEQSAEGENEDDDDSTSKEDSNQQVLKETKATRRSARNAPSSETNQQIHPETTTGDPTMKPGKAARKKS